MSPTTWPHHGPVGPDCPVECLLTALSRTSFNRVARSPDEPRTVGDIVTLLTEGKLPGIEGLGPKRVGEIEAVLVFLGFNITGHTAPTGST